MLSRDELEDSDCYETYLDEDSQRRQDELQERFDALSNAVLGAVEPLRQPANELTRCQTKLEMLAHREVFTAIGMLRRFADMARAVADSATMAAATLQQKGIELDLIMPHEQSDY